MKDIFTTHCCWLRLQHKDTTSHFYHPGPLQELNSALCLGSLTHYVIVFTSNRNGFVPTSFMVLRIGRNK